MPSLSKEKARQKSLSQRKAEKVDPSNLEKILDIQKTKDPPRKAWHRTHGKKTGLGIMAFWKTLFEGNEILPKSKKMTNAEIERQVRLEFPHEKTLLENLDTGRQSVNYYRHLYNKGRMTKGDAPEHISFRYDGDGKIVNTRTGNRLLSEEEIDAYIEKYQG
tara:strand:+ start:5768 stop:6253 length:486 start_codon:yes stop_codon:yes gene_type:complete